MRFPTKLVDQVFEIQTEAIFCDSLNLSSPALDVNSAEVMNWATRSSALSSETREVSFVGDVTL